MGILNKHRDRQTQIRSEFSSCKKNRYNEWLQAERESKGCLLLIKFGLVVANWFDWIEEDTILARVTWGIPPEVQS